MEYYISHDLVLRWCRESVFVVMARLDRDRASETENIKFWLQFIVTCVQGRRETTPSVIIACSFRDRLSDDEVGKAHAGGHNLPSDLAEYL